MADEPARDRPADEELARQARTDPGAYGELYERHAQSIYRFIWNRVRQQETAEDLTSDVFFKALRAIDTFDPERCPFRPWLYRIAVNTLTDHLRKSRPTVDLDQIVERPDPRASVERLVLARRELAEIRAAVERLGDAQRTALTLRLGQGLRPSEISVAMGRSEGAVKLLIHRALSAIQAQLGDDHVMVGRLQSQAE